MKTEVWYNIGNGGDGSVYLSWFESKELAEIDEKFMDEGWGEPCYGSLTIMHDSPIKILKEIKTLDMIINEVEVELKEDWVGEFTKKSLRVKLVELQKLKEKINENKS